MRCKRLLALILVFCLMFSVTVPASAAQNGGDPASQQTARPQENDRIVTGEDTQPPRTLRDALEGPAPDAPGGILIGDSGNAGESGMTETWIAEEVELSAPLAGRELPACVEELRALSNTYAAKDRVSAFVVLDKVPLVNYYSSINDVPGSEGEQAEMWQDAMIMVIEEDVLDGGELAVVTRFTYLTNAIVVETEFENLEKIACLDGVRTVFLTPVFYPCATTDADKLTVSSGQMSDVDDVWSLNGTGFTGEGMTVAVLDTGLDLDHPAFAAAPQGGYWSQEEIAAMLENLDLNAEALYRDSTGKTLTASQLFYNGKVPFAFNYSMGTTNVSHADGIGDHGTHVAGIVAANPVEGTGVVGMAPDAQIIAMKVFNSTTGGANMYDILNALEDCMKLGVDVANLSLGSPAGFTQSGADVVDEIFAAISETDLIVDIAAGNEGTSSYGSLWGPNLQPTAHIDNATISSPSTYANAIAIASVDNKYVAADYFTLADGTRIFYMASVEYLYEYTTIGLVETLADQVVEYVMVPNLGEAADFYNENGESIVEGKIAVVRRGDIAFSAKIANAEAAGAVAVLIWNNDTENIFNFGMSTEDEEGNYPNIPAALIGLTDGQLLADAETKTLVVSSESSFRMDSAGGQMSNFSSWGVSPDLRLVPDISGVGGNVYSCYDGGYYGLMSGTSMATPQVAGITALVLQYLEKNYPNLTAAEKRTLVDALMMSTAVPVVDQDTGLEASPRQQGAGLVNALNAVTAQAYLTVSGSDRAKAELFDSPSGSYSFTFTVHNFGDTANTYTLSASLLCEDYITVDAHPGAYFMAEAEHGLDSSAVTFSSNTVTVPAGGTATVTVSINLTAADKTWIDAYFPNGNYVEGFIYLTGEGEVTLSLPFLGFYGSWQDAPVFDTGYWYENAFWGFTDAVEANEYYHIPWTSLGASNADYALGLNPYVEIVPDASGNVVYSAKNNVLSPNGDGVLDQITDYYLALMRNARWVILTYTDGEGNVLDEEYVDKVSKTMYISGYGGTVPFVYSWYYDSLYDFTDENGDYLEHGTELTLTISGVLDYGTEDVVTDSFQIPITIDTVAPVLNERRIQQSSEEDGNYLTVTFQEEHPAAVILMNKSGTQLYKTYSDGDFVDKGNGNYTVKVDVTGLGDTVTLALCDYACNESYYELKYTLTENMPEMDTSALYAYQVYHEYIYYYYGWDYIFGWATIDKETAYTEMISSDAYEYYALSAAEYVGDYVFAVDAGFNLLYMVPGLWNRNFICNLGMNVIDLAFDDTTGTMYAAVKDSATGICGLYTLDLLTGEMQQLQTYDSHFNMPWAMTFVDGELYCCRFYYNGFYKVDIAGGTYELVAIPDFKPVTTGGGEVSPDYGQSMTYSKADGLIYWAYYDGKSCELITIDPTNWTNTAAAMEWDAEYIGVLTLEPNDYEFPVADKVTKLVLTQDSLVLAADETATLTATALPWNVPADTITWSSADETIATVDENGVVTGVTEGDTVITATCGELTASCAVKVLNVSGSIYYYDYYTGDGEWGAWQHLDLKTMQIQDVVNSPIDFIAADYNGHNGKIYGFDEFGQGYVFDPETGSLSNLGGNSGMLVADMAYDYSSGKMYAVVYDLGAWNTTIYTLSMGSGKLVSVATVSDVIVTLACSTDGQLYGISYDGMLYKIRLPRSASGRAALTEVLQTPVSTVYFGQSMCYDHNNDVIIWNSPEAATLFWLEVLSEEPYAVDLGDPTGSGTVELMGMFSVPEEIPELPYVAAESLEAEDMLLLTGMAKDPSATVSPINATNQLDITLVSADESIARIEDGMVVGVREGTVRVDATLHDNGNTLSCSFTVTVLEKTDKLYGYLVGDLANMDGFYMVELSDANPTDYLPVEFIYYNGLYMCLYSAEYVAADDRVYAYGYDPNDWNANFFYLTIDPKTWSVLEAVDMGDNFPFVYDMAFDYTSGTMYAVAGTQAATDLYMVDMKNGRLIECLLTDPMFMCLTVDADGTLYGMAASEAEYNWDNSSYTYKTNAKLYTIDVTAGTYEVYMDTGVTSTMLSSMAYDYDTGNIYWTALDYSNNNGFYLIDPEQKTAYNLGSIGSAGAQVTGLMIFAESYPQVPETLQSLALLTGTLELMPGESAALETFHQPSAVEPALRWSSGDERIAKVDAKGVVTAVSAGTTTITVTATAGESTLTAKATVIVYGPDDYFLTYNRTDNGFAAISRSDPNNVTMLSQDAAQEDVWALEWVEGTVYAYDAQGNLFTADAAGGYERNYIGNASVAVPEDEVEISGYTTNQYHYYFEVRDMAWDAVNGRMLAVGCTSTLVTYTYDSGNYFNSYSYVMELSGGCKLFEVDLKTGALKELVTIGGAEGYLSNVYMLTVTDQGQAYIFSSYMDYVCKLDTVTGTVTNLTTLQNQGIYGSPDGDPMAMAYDGGTNMIYMLFTEDGDSYYLYTYNVGTTALSCVDLVGLDFDIFAGLAVASHVHTYESGVCTGCGAVDYVPGDVNDDGQIDILDANLIVVYYNEVVELTETQLLAADVNGDGEADIMDANMIVAYYNEAIDSFPANKQ